MLAGAPEYNQCGVRSYKQDIQNQFEKYKSDNSIKYMRELNQAHGIGYNAITNVADLLQIKNGIISLQPQYDMSVLNLRVLHLCWQELLNIINVESDPINKIFKINLRNTSLIIL